MNVTLFLAFLFTAPVDAANDYSFTTIDFPGALGTAAYGINNAGQIVGSRKTTSDGRSSGFLLSAGSFTNIDFPPGTFSGGALGINDAGQIVGEYRACCGADSHGFLLVGAALLPSISLPLPGPMPTGSTTRARS